MNKREFKVVLVVMLIVMTMFTGCKKKDSVSKISDKNSYEVSTNNFKLRVYDKYKEAAGSEEFLRVFGSDDGRQFVVCMDDYVPCTIDAYVDFFSAFLPEAYQVSMDDVVIENIDTIDGYECRLMTLEHGSGDEKIIDQYCVIYKEAHTIMLECSGKASEKDSIREEFLQMVGTVEYTNAYTLPKNYPYTVSNDLFEVSVPEGFVDTVREHSISLSYAMTDDYFRGSISEIVVEVVDDQTKDIYAYAKEAEDEFDNSSLFQRVSTENIILSDYYAGSLDVEACYIKGKTKSEDCALDVCYYEYKGKIYCVRVRYPLGDQYALEDMYSLLRYYEYK